MSEEEQEKVLDRIGGADAGGGNRGLNQKTADIAVPATSDNPILVSPLRLFSVI